ncbi:MAG: hypothetical protein IKF71_04535 [Bacilli bacterium]|nr:hypothetical protein [Bacilli bacterium]
MFERITCVLVSILSIASIFFSSQNMNVTKDNAYATRSNYLDVSFTDVKSTNGTVVSLTPNHQGIVIEEIVLKHVGDAETIQYEVLNNSLSYDVEVTVLVNDKEEYLDDNFHITVTEIGELKSGEKKTGSIEIKYEKQSLEARELPFDIQLYIEQKKGYRA